MTYNLQLPVTQGSYQQVEEAAQYIKQEFGEKIALKIAIFVDSFLTESVGKKLSCAKNCRLIYFKEVPFLNEFCPESENGHFLISKSHFIVNGSIFLNQGFAGGQVLFIPRMLRSLGIEKALFVTCFSSTCEELKLGEVALVDDHCMLTGRNPLFGPNEERWGSRFFDVQGLYSKKIKPKVKTSWLKKKSNLNLCFHKSPIKSISIGHFHGPIFPSPLFARFLDGGSISALCTGVAPEALACKHMGIETACIGLVTHHLQIAENPDCLTARKWDGLRDLVEELC